MKISRLVKHKSIISLYEIYESNDLIHIISEYIKGDSLSSKIKSGGHYTEAQAKILFKNLLAALDIFHQQNIALIDLKPENIIVLYGKFLF